MPVLGRTEMSRATVAVLLSLFALAAGGRDIADDPPPKPADPLATAEGRFAHSIKIPNPVPADSGYRPGMTSKQYFDHLCRTEAGEFIFRTVENVEGMMMLRPRPFATDEMLMDRYALEDPFGYENWEATEPEKIFVNPKGYKYLEKPFDGEGGKKVKRFFGYSARWEGNTMVKTPMQVEITDAPRSRYAYTWRGIRREKDRELGIAGGELIVLDSESSQVLAVRRGYIRTGNVKTSRTGIWWLTGEVCPKSRETMFATERFLRKVLKPIAKNETRGG